jgi:6-pyruvoyltetrahydropterin/6-carboxytetrahydropterin synthase
VYEVSVKGHFDAAHYLREYGGKCENLHGHRFLVTVTVKASALDERGLAFDFTELKGHLNQILERYDHASLNDIEPFTDINPSSENIASTLYRELRARLAGTPVSLASVQVAESPEAFVTYTA